MIKSRKKYSFKFALITILVFSMFLIFSTSASAVSIITPTRIVSCTVVDRSCEENHFHLNVNITNTFVGNIYDISPASWTLEWQVLYKDKTIYTRGKREGRLGTTVASVSEQFCLPALKTGYFRYRMTVSNYNETAVGDWVECYVDSYHGGGGGIHRSIRI